MGEDGHVDEHLRREARDAIGFMPEEEGLALYEAGLEGATRGPLLEVGSYCGKSAIYLGAAAEERMTVLFSVDHHRGSEEHQPGEEYHDPRLVDPATGKLDTLPVFKETIVRAGLENSVVAVVGDSRSIAERWERPLGMVFIDGGHSPAAAEADYRGWSPHVAEKGILAIHDVFDRPEEGGRAPRQIFERALRSGAFEEIGRCASLRVLRRTGTPL